MRFTTNILVASLMFSSVFSSSPEPRLSRRSGLSGGSGGGSGGNGIFNRLLESVFSKFNRANGVNSELPHPSEVELMEEGWEEEPRFKRAPTRRSEKGRKRGRTEKVEEEERLRIFPRRRNAPRHHERRRRLERRQLGGPALQPHHPHQQVSPNQRPSPEHSPRMMPNQGHLNQPNLQPQGNAMTANNWIINQPVYFRTMGRRTYMYDANSQTWVIVTPQLARMLMNNENYRKWLYLNTPPSSGNNNPVPSIPESSNNVVWNPATNSWQVIPNVKTWEPSPPPPPSQVWSPPPQSTHPNNVPTWNPPVPRFGIPRQIENPTNPWKPQNPGGTFNPPGMNDPGFPQQGADILTRTMTYLNQEAVFKLKSGGKYGKEDSYVFDEVFGA